MKSQLKQSDVTKVMNKKWMNFYKKVLSKFAAQSGLKIRLNIEIAPEAGVSNQKVDEINVALRELALSDELSVD